MQYNSILAGAYQVKKTLDHATYSVLCIGKRTDTGQKARLRLWPSAHVGSKEEQKRIQAEVAAIQQVQHPHLLPIEEVRASEQGVFLASAFVEGDSLHTRLNQHFLKALPLDEALEIIRAVGQALHALHQHGIVHGNLTPLAILISESGHISVGEFHLQSIRDNIQEYQAALDENIPHCWYMAPEQFSEQPTALSDQYALGCLAYVLLTGRVPFAGSARAALQQKHQNEQPKSLISFNAAISASLEEAVLKALAKQPAERHSSVAAFLEALGLPVSSPIVAQTEPEPVVDQAVAEQQIVAQPAVQPQAALLIEQPTLIQPAVTPQPAINSPLAERETLKQQVLGRALAKEAKKKPSTPSDKAALLAASAAASTVSAPPDVSAVSPEIKARAGQPGNMRKLVKLAPIILLVLLIIVGGSEWLLLSGGHTPVQQILGSTTSPATSGATSTVGGAQVTKTSTVTSITMNNLTPTAQPPSAARPTPTATSRPAPTATPTSVTILLTPVLDCIEQTDSYYVAHFGYVNNGGSTVSIQRGNNNHLTPFDGLQPTSFAPGTHHQVFEDWFSRGSSVSWTLNGMTITADRHSQMC